MGTLNGLSPPAPLRDDHDATDFDCGKPELTTWLKQKARKNETAGGSRCFVVCEGPRIIAYYALAAGAVAREGAPPTLTRNMPDPIPVILLARLAVDSRFQGQRIGAHLLKDAILRTLAVSRDIGARALLVHAIDDAASTFYRHYGFQAFAEENHTLFLPLAHIAAKL